MRRIIFGLQNKYKCLGTQYEDLAHVVSGWGTTSSGGSISNVLLETAVTTMSNDKCCSTPYSECHHYIFKHKKTVYKMKHIHTTTQR